MFPSKERERWCAFSPPLLPLLLLPLERAQNSHSLREKHTHALSFSLSRPRAFFPGPRERVKKKKRSAFVCWVVKNCFFSSLFFFPRERERVRDWKREKIPFFHKKRLFFASLEFSSSLLLLLLLRFETFYMYRREHTRTDASDDDYKHR